MTMFAQHRTVKTNAQFASRRVAAPRQRSVRAQAVNVEQLKSAKADLEELVRTTSCAPILVRLAWHDSGTFNKDMNVGGANGTIRFEKEITAPPNAGLDSAIKLVTKIKDKYPDVTWADLYQLGSAAAITVAGGPKIDMEYGRVDGTEEQVGDTTGLPAAAAPFPNDEGPGAHLRSVFYRMGLNDQEIVALSGAHTLGRAYKDRSGAGKAGERAETKYTKDGPGTKGGVSWTPEWLKFDNSYFVEVKAKRDDELLVLETDDVLFNDDKFRPYAEAYAESEEKFFSDYAAAHKKLSELGVKWTEGAPVRLD